MLWLAQQQLKSKSPRIRREAIQRLRRSGGEAVLVSLLRVLREDTDPLVRGAAAEGLADFRDRRVVEALGAALADPGAEVRLAAVEALRRLGDQAAVPALSPLIATPDRVLRSRVAQALKLLGWQPRDEAAQAQFLVALGELDRAAFLGRAAVGPLAEVLKDPAYQRRVLAVNRLAEIGDPSAALPLLSALRDPEAVVRTAAANALGRLGDAKAVSQLLAMLRDRDANVRAATAGALGALRDPKALEVLVGVLRDPHWEVRAAALEALGRLKDSRALEGMMEGLKDSDREVREKAAEALGMMAHAEAAPALVLALLDPEASVRQSAGRALQQVDPYWERAKAVRALLPSIEAIAQQTDYSVRGAAAAVLKRSGLATGVAPDTGFKRAQRRSAVEVLQPYLEEADPDLRQAAVECLGRIRPAGLRLLLSPLAANDEDPGVRAAAALALAGGTSA